MFSCIKKGVVLSTITLVSLCGAETKSLLQKHQTKRKPGRSLQQRVQTVTRASLKNSHRKDSWGAEEGWSDFEVSALLFPTDFIYENYADDDYFFEHFSPAPYADRIIDYLPKGWYKGLSGKSVVSDYIVRPVFGPADELKSYEELVSDSAEFTDTTIFTAMISSLTPESPEIGRYFFTENGAPETLLHETIEDSSEDLFFTYENDLLSSFSYVSEQDGETEIESYFVSYANDEKAEAITCIDSYDDGTGLVSEAYDSTFFTYAGDLLTKESYFLYSDGSYELSLEAHYIYDNNDNVTAISTSDKSGTTLDSVAFTYDGGVITEILTFDGGEKYERCTYEYNSKGLLTLERSYDWIDNQWEIWDSTYYEYDDDNNIVSLGWDGVYDCSFSYEDGYPSMILEFEGADILGIYSLSIKDTEEVLHSNKISAKELTYTQRGTTLLYRGSIAQNITRVRIVNALGKVVFETAPKHQNGEITVDFNRAGVAQGFYMVQVQTPQRVLSHKIRK